MQCIFLKCNMYSIITTVLIFWLQTPGHKLSGKWSWNWITHEPWSNCVTVPWKQMTRHFCKMHPNFPFYRAWNVNTAVLSNFPFYRAWNVNTAVLSNFPFHRAWNVNTAVLSNFPFYRAWNVNTAVLSNFPFYRAWNVNTAVLSNFPFYRAWNVNTAVLSNFPFYRAWNVNTAVLSNCSSSHVMKGLPLCQKIVSRYSPQMWNVIPLVFKEPFKWLIINYCWSNVINSQENAGTFKSSLQYSSLARSHQGALFKL